MSGSCRDTQGGMCRDTANNKEHYYVYHEMLCIMECTCNTLPHIPPSSPIIIPSSSARRGNPRASVVRGGTTSTCDKLPCCMSCACRRRLSVVCACHAACVPSSSVIDARAPRNATSGDVLGRPLLREGCDASHESSYSGGIPEGLALCRPRLLRGVGERVGCMRSPMWFLWSATR